MLTKAFNCPECKEPFDCKKGEPRTPVYSIKAILCRTCAPSSHNLPQRGLMDFLSQPAFKRTDEGYEYTLPINDPVCFGCDENIKLLHGAFAIQCGHYLCKNCVHKRIDGAYLGFCALCNVYDSTPGFCPKDGTLTDFALETGKTFYDDFEAKIQEMLNTLRMKEEGRKNCGDCGIERPVERLFKCNDCQRVICGNCCFDSHRIHDVVKLLGIQLDDIHQQNEKIYTETLEGLHGNLKYVQKNIDDAVEKVLIAGKDHLAKVKGCHDYKHAKSIAKTVIKAAGNFEKHFEVYIPVAREFATRLEELGEELRKEEK